jgi:hypothetical protein
MPTIFQFNEASNQKSTQSRKVKVNSLTEKTSDLEISFSDPAYNNQMILVLKRITPELKIKILNLYNKAFKV